MTATPTDHAAAFSPDDTHADRVTALRLLPARRLVLLAADWSEAVLPVWERVYPADDRPRRAIAAAWAAHAAAHAAHAATYAAYAAAHAAHAAGRDGSGVRRLWDAAYNAGHAWRSEWRTPLTVEMARDPADYLVLLDLLADEGVPVEGLRGLPWRLSNWAVYHLLSPAGGQK